MREPSIGGFPPGKPVVRVPWRRIALAITREMKSVRSSLQHSAGTQTPRPSKNLKRPSSPGYSLNFSQPGLINLSPSQAQIHKSESNNAAWFSRERSVMSEFKGWNDPMKNSHVRA